MTKKAEFNAEEWSLVQQGPFMAGMRVITAERGGTLRESFSMAQAYGEARRSPGSSELIDELVASPPAVQPQELGSSDDLARTSVDRLRQAMELVRSKASAEDAEAYGAFVLDLAQRVAESHREGGFLGVGGKPVSESEQAALDEVRATVGG